MLDAYDTPAAIAAFLDQHHVRLHHGNHALRVLHDPALDVLVLLVESDGDPEGPTDLYVTPMRRTNSVETDLGGPDWTTDFTRVVLGEPIAFRDFAPTDLEQAQAVLARVYDAMVREAHVLPGQLDMPEGAR